MGMRSFRLLPIVVLWWCLPAFAKDYYVRASGNDQMPGVSHSTAWRTLSHALNQVGPGDTVYVGAGVYNGQLYFNQRGGHSDNPVRFVADTTGEHARDPGVVTLRNASGLIHLLRSHHVHFIGFRMEVTSGNAVYNDGSSGIVLDKCTIVSGGTGVFGSNLTSWVITDSSISASNGHGVYLSGGSMNLSGSTVTLTGGSNSPLFLGGRSTATVLRSSLIGGGHVLYLDGGNLTIINSVLANGSNNGLHAANSPTITMVHCTVHGVGQDGMYLAGGNITLHNTIFSNPGRYAIFRANNAAMTESHNLYHGWGLAMTYGFTPASPILGDPRFTDINTLKFGLPPGSPARNSGINAELYTSVDRAGDVRPQGNGWDIGAFEGDGILRTIYVRSSGSDSNSGRTPARAYRTIQRAIQEATGPDYTIYVGPGTYDEALFIGTGVGATAANGTSQMPNRLIADIAGTQTGDPPGPVVISGNNRAIARGLFVSGRSHWHAEGFRFTGHGQTAVQVSSGGMTLTGCTIDVPPNYGVLMQGNSPMAVHGNVFNFAANSGHTVVVELTNGGSSTLRIENNRMHNDGEQYLASSYRTQVPTSFNAAHTWRYAIYAFGQNNPGGSVIVRNNIISDKYVGIYGTSNSSGPLVISNNTVTGCSFSIYTVGGPAGSIISNNIISSSYYGALTDGLAPVVALCEHNLTFTMSNLDRRNFPEFIITSDPMLADPRAGHFALFAGSASIDAGTELGATSEDIAGNPRPVDGRGDGVAAHDLGAMEEVVPRDRVRVVRWREISPVGDD